MPLSSQKARILLITAVRRLTSRSRTPVQRLQVELLDRLGRHERIVGRWTGLRYRLGVEVVVLVGTSGNGLTNWGAISRTS